MSPTLLPLGDDRMHEGRIKDAPRIDTPRKFRRALSSERACADRGHREFSLVTLRIRDASHRRRVEEIVSQWLDGAGHVHSQAGWLGKDRIAVLLPATSTEKAAAAARSILDAVSSTGLDWSRSIEWRVDTYPGGEEHGKRPWPPFKWTGRLHGNGIWQRAAVEPASALVGVHSEALANGPATAPIFEAGSVNAAAYIQRLDLRSRPRWKRAMDILGAVAALVLLSPLLMLIAAYIKCVSRGPVFFRQRRYGLAGQPFTMWKFRTIKTSQSHEDRQQSYVADLMQNDRPLQKRDLSKCVIFGGAVLRRFGIDELPQLFNVLSGEMSLVGPRPDVLPLGSYEAWQRRRFDVEPGITGLWQVSGKNQTTFSAMIRLDIAYVRCRSFRLDVSILLRTINAVIRN
jgi:lipopolysaccharide/colanic/teichoic acid biosynthesis glycosyltransferase